VGKWEFLGIVDEGVNSKTRILLQYSDFHGQNVNEAWSLLEWIAWDSFEFEKASCIYGYSFHGPCVFYARLYYAPFWCDLCNSSDHNTISCPYYACYVHPDSSLPLAQCTGLKVGEPFGLVAKFGMNNACCGLKTPFVELHHLVDTPLEGCRDMFVHEGSPSQVCDDVSPNSLERSHVSPMCSQPSFSPNYLFDMLNDISKLCDSNMHLGYDDNMLNVIGGTDETFESLG